MKYEFHDKASKIYDFLMFPRCLHFWNEYKKYGSKSNYAEVMDQEYLDLMQQTAQALQPFAEEITEFYHGEFSSEHDFIDLLINGTGILDFADEIDYLNSMLELSDTDIRFHVLTHILRKNQNFANATEAQLEARKLLQDFDKVKSIIKNLSVESATKWSLYLIFDEPREYTQRYVQLMKELLPIFAELYQPYAQRVKEYGEYLTTTFNQEGLDGIERLSNGNAKKDVLEGENVGTILTSLIASYTLNITIGIKEKYMIWGLKIEEAFSKIREINENKTLERVSVFKNLGDKTRYEVLKLFATGVTSTKEIAKTLGVTSATISYHINNLAVAKILKIGKTNDKVNYQVDFDFLHEVLDGLHEDLRP